MSSSARNSHDASHAGPVGTATGGQEAGGRRSSQGPSGSACNSRIRLNLTRLDRPADTFAQVHELHHRSLNDSTAWGSLLHLVTEAPAAFVHTETELMDACRTTQESYASYAAYSVVESILGPQPHLLARWPRYEALMRILAEAVSSAGGPQRRYLLATALARVCMQCPVADVAITDGPRGFTLSKLRDADRPDGRFRRLMGSGVLLDAAAEANAASPQASDLDTPEADPLAVVADQWDGVWHEWEVAAYDVLALELRRQGAEPLSYNGHLETTAAMIDAVVAAAGPLRLRAQARHEPALSDVEVMSAQLVDIEEALTEPPYRARVLEGPAEGVADVVSEFSRIAGEPALVIDCRLAERLAGAYRWEEGAPAGDGVLTGIRLAETDDEETTVVWVPVRLDSLPRLLADWSDRGRAVAVVAASCFVEPSFSARGFRQLSELLPVAVLIDVPPDRIQHNWHRDDASISHATVRVDDRAGVWWALAFETGAEDVLWFLLGADPTIGLFRQSLGAGTSDLRLADERMGLLQLALTSTLAFETTLDFKGVEART